MVKSLRGSETEKNLLAAFAGESQARNRYTYYAGVARREGYEQIAAVFEETADNEKEHAKLFFKFLEGGDVEVNAAYPAGRLGDTMSNLEAAADGERMEWSTIYADFEKVALDEGFSDVAVAFQQVAKVEAFHEGRFRKLADNIAKSSVFKKDSSVKWHCRNCGYVYEGLEAPKQCPACRHPQSYFELLAENY